MALLDMVTVDRRHSVLLRRRLSVEQPELIDMMMRVSRVSEISRVERSAKRARTAQQMPIKKVTLYDCTV